jgi:hypothetical protein
MIIEMGFAGGNCDSNVDYLQGSINYINMQSPISKFK